MGYERKRGKLADLNALLREKNSGGFSLMSARRGAHRREIRRSLWTRTRNARATPRASSSAPWQHPLNRPVYDAALGRVRAGYGILQPRVSVSCRYQPIPLCAA